MTLLATKALSLISIVYDHEIYQNQPARNKSITIKNLRIIFKSFFTLYLMTIYLCFPNKQFLKIFRVNHHALSCCRTDFYHKFLDQLRMDLKEIAIKFYHLIVALFKLGVEFAVAPNVTVGLHVGDEFSLEASEAYSVDLTDFDDSLGQGNGQDALEKLEAGVDTTGAASAGESAVLHALDSDVGEGPDVVSELVHQELGGLFPDHFQGVLDQVCHTLLNVFQNLLTELAAFLWLRLNLEMKLKQNCDRSENMERSSKIGKQEDCLIFVVLFLSVKVHLLKSINIEIFRHINSQGLTFNSPVVFIAQYRPELDPQKLGNLQQRHAYTSRHYDFFSFFAFPFLFQNKHMHEILQNNPQQFGIPNFHKLRNSLQFQVDIKHGQQSDLLLDLPIFQEHMKLFPNLSEYFQLEALRLVVLGEADPVLLVQTVAMQELGKPGHVRQQVVHCVQVR